MGSTLSASDLVEQRLGLATTTYFRKDFPQLLEQLSAGNVNKFTHELHTSDEFSHTWQSIIQSLAIGETYFFRDESHFRLLRETILPQMIEARRMRGERFLNLWSVGCATGEEPYSIAMLLYDMLPDYEQWSVKITGTDLNARALELARQGIYRPWSFRQTQDHVYRFFDPVEGGLRIKPEIRRMVTFRQDNVLKTPPLPQFDVVMCRNVMLYFTPERVRDMENLLHDVLFPGGWLLLGQSETIKHGREGWITHLFPGAPVYQKANNRAESEIREHVSREYILRQQGHTEKQVRNPSKSGTPRKSNAMKSDLTKPASKPVPEPKPAGRVSAGLHINEYEMALHALQHDQPDEAQIILKRILTQNPNNAAAHVLMAVSYADKKQTAHAHEHLDVALHIDPLLADGHYLRGLLFYEAAENEKAKKSFQHTLYCQRHHPLASFTLGILVARDGDIPRAVRHWENARRAILSLAPDSPLSDLSEMTAGQLDMLIDEQLAGWE